MKLDKRCIISLLQYLEQTITYVNPTDYNEFEMNSVGLGELVTNVSKNGDYPRENVKYAFQMLSTNGYIIAEKNEGNGRILITGITMKGHEYLNQNTR